jgi:oligoribonuclease NrnB/cAMP/cGMP phosphodiesterase (DHH superfamily)
LTDSWGKIVTHTDFDGVVSAAICSYCLGIDDIVFAGPTAINRNLIAVSDRDVVCDLPYPLRCGLWFDHHPGNLEELRLRGYDPAQVPGRFDLRDSCSRVVHEYFSPRLVLPPFVETTVLETDMIDAFKYRDIEDWRKETPGKIVDGALRMAGFPRKGDLLRRRVVFLLRDHPLEVVATKPEIMEPYEAYRGQEERMLAILREASYFLPDDQGREIIIVDLTRYKRRPSVAKNLAFLLYPASQAVVEIRSLYDRGIKTNDLGVSISLSPNVDAVTLGRDLGEMMRDLNIGDGHKGAAGGKIRCGSKDEMARRKGELLTKVLVLWQAAA